MFNQIRGTNGQSPSLGGPATPGDAQGEKAAAGLRCPECGVKFESAEDLEGHVQADHPEISPETSAAGKKAEASPAPKVRRGILLKRLFAVDFLPRCGGSSAVRINKKHLR